jgi:similar to stage IV sporulation protein
VPHLLYSYRKRWGLAVGAIIAAFIMLSSDDYLWDIRVTGNEKLTYSYVVEALAENGFSVGSRLDGLDIDRTETLTLLNSEGISWMSINMNGNVAYVNIREKKSASGSFFRFTPAKYTAAT